MLQDIYSNEKLCLFLIDKERNFIGSCQFWKVPKPQIQVLCGRDSLQRRDKHYYWAQATLRQKPFCFHSLITFAPRLQLLISRVSKPVWNQQINFHHSNLPRKSMELALWGSIYGVAAMCVLRRLLSKSSGLLQMLGRMLVSYLCNMT